MPKIFGTNLLGILAATVLFFLLGWLWYGVIFEDMWLALMGVSKEAAAAAEAEAGPMMLVWGFLITLLQVLGLAYILHHASASLLVTCVKIGAIVAVLLALPLIAYNTLYGDAPTALLGLNFVHILIGYIISCAVLSFFRGKDAIGD